MEAPKDLSILFVGNPLLDLSVEDETAPSSLLEKYDL